MPAKPIMKIRRSAAFFAVVSRDRKKIAAHFEVEPRTIYRWATDPEWTKTLDFLGYDGDRTFEGQPLRDTKRDAGDTYEVAKSAYFEAVENGIPPHQRASIVSKTAGITPRRARDWARRFDWDNEVKKAK